LTGALTLILAERMAAMAKKPRKPNFDQALEILRAHAFDVSPYSGGHGGSRGEPGGMLVTKHGAGAVLIPATDKNDQKSAPGVLMISPGIMVRGEVARLVDRGYQKFIKSEKYELPAMAAHLQAVHTFTEELKELTGVESLYNEALGTVSDIYLYDRLQGRDDAQPGAGKSN
jgi:hypothetical protein